MRVTSLNASISLSKYIKDAVFMFVPYMSAVLSFSEFYSGFQLVSDFL
jgi:hypothetical protein